MDEPPPPPTDALLLQTYDWQRKAEAEVRKQTHKQTNKQMHCGPETLQSSRANAGVLTRACLIGPRSTSAWHRRAK
jgi:hypothetical protein